MFETLSTNIPVTPSAYDSTYGGSWDFAIAIAKFTGLDPAPWRIRQGGIPGAVDTPNLAGSGDLIAGTPTRLSVRGGAPSAPAIFRITLPATAPPPMFAKGLVPEAVVMLPAGTDEEGARDLSFTWPALPSGLRILVQVWIADPSAPNGWSATNALQLDSQ